MEIRRKIWLVASRLSIRSLTVTATDADQSATYDYLYINDVQQQWVYLESFPR